MRVRYDAILSHHLNPLTCGVAKWNHELARRLSIPCLSLETRTTYPLLSVKQSELTAKILPRWATFDVLWHDQGDDSLNLFAQRVFYATQTGCPSTIRGNLTRGTISVLTFGFAHKFQGVHFEQLKIWLDRTHEDYTVSLSTGIHEGTPWDVGFTENIALMRGIFGDHLRVLGFLGDDALAKELRECTAVALFYEPAVRANNTTFWAALDAGAMTITNMDRESPEGLEHGVNVFNAARLTTFPCGEMIDGFSRAAARRLAQRYGWDRVLGMLA